MLYTLADMLHSEPPPVQWAVQGVIAQGDRCVVYGEWGSLKSWLLLHLSLHLAAGKPWLGHPVPAPQGVLYIDEEMHRDTMQRRVRRLHTGAGLAEPLPFCAVSRQGLLMDPSGPARVVAWLSAAERAFGTRPSVVIIESLRRVLLGGENDSRDVIAFWRTLESLSKLGLTLIISHHMHKPSQDGRGVRHRASGSGDIMAGADSAIAIERVSEARIRLESTKSREAPEEHAWLAEMSGAPQEPVVWKRAADMQHLNATHPPLAFTSSFGR